MDCLPEKNPKFDQKCIRNQTSNNASDGPNLLIDRKFDELMIDLRPLGFDAKLNEWIDAKKNNPILSNSSVVCKEQLESEKSKLHDIEVEISNRFFSALDSIPSQILCKLPGFDPDVYQRLKMLNQHVKARVRQTNRKLLAIEQAKVNSQDNQIQMESINFCDSNSSKVQFLNPDISSSNYEKQSMNANLINNISNSGGNAIPQTKSATRATTILDGLPIANIKMQNNFQVKKPATEVLASQLVKKTEKLKQENDKKIKNSKTFNKSQVCNNTKNNKHTEDPEEIINMHTQDFFASSVAWNNSEERYLDHILNSNSFEETPKSDQFSNEFPDVSKITETINKFRNSLNSHSVKETDSEEILPFSNNTSTVQFIGDVENDSADGKFENLDFPHCREMLNVFRKKFGLHQFRPNQLAAINAVILGYDCFILMPTGGGKSLCYQLPALLTSEITIVVSPLRSLIIDQTQKLASLDIPAMYMTGDLTDAEVNTIYEKLHESEPKLKLLYVTPEKLSLSTKLSDTITMLYQRGKLARFVIDEVHCVSQWGHDFRPDYKKLSVLKEIYPRIPMVVLTATATPRVRSDILHQLHLNSPKWFMSSFNRPNLRYSVTIKKSKSSCQQIIELIKSKFMNECGIVYCISRKDCDDHARALIRENINAISYHAGLADKERIERQSRWISEKVKVICATIAFGMGIDKPNVRFVIHAALPKSIEGYYQESGRAGRDGEPADCVLLYSYGDVYRYRNLMERNEYVNAEALRTHMDNLYKMVHFCDNLADCRRALQLNYFGEKFDRSECIANEETTCDNCRTYDQFVSLDVTEDAKALVKLVLSLDRVRKNNVTMLQVVDIYKGSNVSSISYKLGHAYREWFGQGQSLTKYEIERLLHNLVGEEYLCENMQPNNGIVCAYVVPGRLANEFLTQNNVQIFLQKKRVLEKPAPKLSTIQMSAVTNVEIKDLEQRCYSDLLEMVNGIAGALDVSANSIMNMVALRAMSQQLPCDETAMLKIPHVTKANFDKYGKALLDVTQKYAKEKRELLKEEERNQPPTLDFDVDESEDEWADSNKSNPNKRSKTVNEIQSKKLKNDIDLTTNQGFPQSHSTNDSGFNSNNVNYKANNAFNCTRKNASFNRPYKRKANYRRTNRSFGSTRGNKSSVKRGKNKGTSTNYKAGPGLCELTKKEPIKK